jgi:hypothetical protein
VVVHLSPAGLRRRTRNALDWPRTGIYGSLWADNRHRLGLGTRRVRRLGPEAAVRPVTSCTMPTHNLRPKDPPTMTFASTHEKGRFRKPTPGITPECAI